MICETIETIDEWNDMQRFLREFDYHHFQSQFGVNDPEGYHVIYISAYGTPVKIVTHTEKIYKFICKFASNTG